MLKTLNHTPFKGKKVLVVVAHPDDECLSFYGGLKELTKNSQVTVLSATYCRASDRGRELKSACLALGIDCGFLGIADLGFRSLLQNFEREFKNYMAKGSFDIIITHPPHGGEKPHPHHLQVFLTLFIFGLKNQLKFGFFSKSRTPFFAPSGWNNLFKLKVLPILFLYSVRTSKILMWKYRWQWCKILGKQLPKLCLKLVFQSIFFQRYQIKTSIEEKRKILRLYFSQRDVLEAYKSKFFGQEYLFFITLFKREIQIAENSISEYPLEAYDGTKNFGNSWIGIS